MACQLTRRWIIARHVVQIWSHHRAFYSLISSASAFVEALIPTTNFSGSTKRRVKSFVVGPPPLSGVRCYTHAVRNCGSTGGHYGKLADTTTAGGGVVFSYFT